MRGRAPQAKHFQLCFCNFTKTKKYQLAIRHRNKYRITMGSNPQTTLTFIHSHHWYLKLHIPLVNWIFTPLVVQFLGNVWISTKKIFFVFSATVHELYNYFTIYFHIKKSHYFPFFLPLKIWHLPLFYSLIKLILYTYFKSIVEKICILFTNWGKICIFPLFYPLSIIFSPPCCYLAIYATLIFNKVILKLTWKKIHCIFTYFKFWWLGCDCWKEAMKKR